MDVLNRISRLVFFLIAVYLLSSCKSKQVSLFEALPSSHTNVTFINKPEKHPLLNILYYLYYYNGGGVATGDINNDGLMDVYLTANNKGGNKLYLNKGNFVFEDITAKAAVAGTADWCTGVTMADINSDGLLDIYVSTVSQKYGLKGHNLLYINNGNLTFSEKSTDYGLDASCFTTQTAFFDYDRDGDLDCYMLNQSHHPHANIVDTINRRGYDSLSGDRLYRNDGALTRLPSGKIKGGFIDVSSQAGIYQSNLGYGLGIAVADINNDGWDDIYVGNDFHENDYYYVNNGNGTFRESGASHFRHYSRFSMGNDIADYNNDGQADIVTVDMLPPDEKILKTYGSDENPDIYKVKLELRGYQHQYSKNCLQRNNGNGISFSETALQSGVAATDWSWCPLFADFDNDGNKDLFITSGIVKRPVDLDFVRFSGEQKAKGMDATDKFDDETINAMPDGTSHPFLFKGDGKLTFEDVSKIWGTQELKGYSNGAAYADLDNDGNLDLVINYLNSEALILKNKTSKKNFLSISFMGDSLNTAGIGCKAWVFASTAQGSSKMQYQQMMPARGFMSSSSSMLHFGLDTTSIIDSVLIVWPNQRYQLIKNPRINQTIKANKNDAVNDFSYAAFFTPQKEPLIDVTNRISCDWKHKENDFLDYNVQYLIPHALSTRGPKMAVADVNNDGLDDFYVCGAKLQPGALMIQQKDGTFKENDTELFSRFAAAEEVDAVFFDANNDSFVDLFVISGGNEIPASGTSLLDKLYLNDGKGNFSYADGALSVVFENKSCVAVDDIDHDGDTDIFIGNMASPVKYGLPTTSYMYLNDGNGKFIKAGDPVISLYLLGMVTAATFADLDKDGWKDLIVTGEWMPMKIFKNNKGKFTAADIPQSTGLWQTVYTTDVNGDGFMDILAGNWGINSKLWAGKNGSLKLYVKDFDNNGTVEQIMAYTIDGKEYPFLAKDELEKALPVLKKAYLKYSDVAGKTVDYILYDLFKDYTELKAEVLSSSCFINDGKGNFKRVDLPDEIQLAPVYAFTTINHSGVINYMAAGNFYGVIPYEGRYDALQPSFFTFNSKTASFQHTGMLASVTGQMRDLKWVNTLSGKLLAGATNNGPLIFLQSQNAQ